MRRITELKHRFVILSEVLRSTHDAAYLTVAQKIMINQERADLLRCIVAYYNNRNSKRTFKVSDEIENIVTRVVYDFEIKYSDTLFDDYIVL